MKNSAIVIAVYKNYITIKDNNRIVNVVVRKKMLLATEILVGDQVLFSEINSQTYVINKLLPRKNFLYRPKIANIDQAIIVSAIISPKINTIIINKLITIFNFYKIKIVFLFTKIDLVENNNEIWKKIEMFQKLGCENHFISNSTKSGIAELLPIFDNKLSLLTGLSGVGKSSLLNLLNSQLNIVTKEISIASSQGKHTTTTSKLYFLLNGIIADTPGFTTLKLIGFTPFDIASNFPVIKNYINKCKFRNCLHQKETGCEVVKNLNDSIVHFFYQDYCKILLEFLTYNYK